MRWRGLLSLLVGACVSTTAAAQDAWVFASAISCASAPVYGLPFNQCWVSNTRGFRIGNIRAWRLLFADSKSEVAVGLYKLVEPRGAWEHSAYQSDNQFVLEVRAQKVDPNKLVQGAGYAGEKLSLNFQNIEVRALLQVIADFTNFNVVTSDTVTGNVTLRLKDVPWDQALDIILRANKLGYIVDGTIVRIAPLAVLADEETQHAFLAGAETERTGEVYNVGTGRRITLLEIIAEMNKHLGTNLPPVFGPTRAGDVLHSQACLKRIESAIGYRPIVDFEDGLRRTLAAAAVSP